MRWLLPLLLLAACSSDPAAPVDAGPVDVGVLDTGPTLCTPGLSTTCSCSALGTSTYVCPPSGLAPAVCPCVDVDAALDVPEDRPAPVDAGSDAGAVDAVAVADVPAADVADVAVVDAGTDVVAVGDTGPVDAGVDVVAVGDSGVDVQLVDVVADRGVDVVAVADVPRDAGPVDGGPVVYDLEVARGAESYFVAARETYPGGLAEDCVAPPTVTSCSVARGVLAFSVRACGVQLTGSMAIATSTPRSLSIFSGGGGSFAPTVRLQAGARVTGSPPRQSFHVQAASSPFQGEPGLSGIPGRTVDPALADLWLLGCVSD